MFVSHDALECPGKRHICVIVHPIRAQTELVSGLRDAGKEPLLRIGKTERAILGYEGAVDVVDVLGALAVGEQGVEDHDGAAVHDEADLPPEGVVQPLGEIGERLLEHLARQRNVVHVFQRRNEGRAWWTCLCLCSRHHRWRHRHGHGHGHMHEGHDGALHRWPSGYGLGEGVERHLGAWDDKVKGG